MDDNEQRREIKMPTPVSVGLCIFFALLLGGFGGVPLAGAALNWMRGSGERYAAGVGAVLCFLIAFYCLSYAWRIDDHDKLSRTHTVSKQGYESDLVQERWLQEQEKTKQERMRTWTVKDELGLDLDDDDIIEEYEPDYHGIGYLVRKLFGQLPEQKPARKRSRTVRYQEKQPQARSQPDVKDLTRNRAESNVAQFIKDSWMISAQMGCEPAQKAPGLARSYWCKKDAGRDDVERQFYDAAIAVCVELGIVIGRDGERRLTGYFGADLNTCLKALRDNVRYVTLPRVLAISAPRPQPSQDTQVTQAPQTELT